MPDVFLTPGELKGRRALPKRCVVCGTKGAKSVLTRFAVSGGVHWADGGSRVTKILQAPVPLCSNHRGYFSGWEFTVRLLFLCWFGMFVLIILGAILCAVLKGPVGVVMLTGIPLGMLSGVVITAVYLIGTMMRVHPTQVSRQGLNLAGVHPDFAEALEDLRDEEDEEDDDRFDEVRRRS